MLACLPACLPNSPTRPPTTPNPNTNQPLKNTPQVGKAVWAEVSKKMEGAGSKEGVAALSAELKALKVRTRRPTFFLFLGGGLCVSV